MTRGRNNTTGAEHLGDVGNCEAVVGQVVQDEREDNGGKREKIQHVQVSLKQGTGKCHREKITCEETEIHGRGT